MIWVKDEAPVDNRSALRSHMAQLLRECSPHTPHDDPAHEALADATAVYLLEQNERVLINPHHIVATLACALANMGKKECAQRLLERGGINNPGLERLATSGSLPAAIWRVCAAQLLRPAPGEGFRGGDVWIIDLAPLKDGRAELLEMTLWRFVRQLVEDLAYLWDASSGRGAVGIVGVRPPTRRKGPRGRRRRELLHYGRTCLERLQAGRNWKYCPEVFFMELPVTRRKAA